MDTYDIAKLVTPQGSERRLGIRYGTVVSVGPGNSLGLVPDGGMDEVPCVRCCSPSVGDRAIVVVNDTEWLAMAVVGGDGGGGGGGTSGNCSCSAISVSRVDSIWDSVPYTLALERIKDEQIDDMYKE